MPRKTFLSRNHGPQQAGCQRGSSLPGVLGGVVIAALVTGAIYGRQALSADDTVHEPLTVSTVTFQAQDAYERAVSYLGLVSSGKKARLGFEVAGQIATLPVRQGSQVEAGDVIATLDDATLQARRRATAADLEQARAERELAALKSRRQKELVDTGAVSMEAYDETRLRARALSSRVEAIAARLDAIDIELAKSRLRAPYDGVVADRYLHPGAVVSPGTAVVQLLQQGDREAHIGVAASRAATLRPGNDYTLSLRDEPLTARLLSVRADVDPRTRAATAVFALPDEVAALDGEPVTLALTERVPQQGGWLPVAALLEGRRGLWTVLRIEQRGADKVTVREAVEVIDVQGNRAYVRGSLRDGAIVVSDGVHRVTAGNPVYLAGSR